MSKGQIIVKSPNGPNEITTISSGTSAMLYFIALKNWLKLKKSIFPHAVTVRPVTNVRV